MLTLVRTIEKRNERLENYRCQLINTLKKGSQNKQIKYFKHKIIYIEFLSIQFIQSF